jgi:peptide/nickel transport system ATP-binding protein
MTGQGALLQTAAVSKDFRPRRGIFASLGGAAPEVVRAVTDVDLVLREGEVLSLVGESGSGKSTLGRLIARLEAPTSGRIAFDGADVTDLKGGPLKAYRRSAQIIFQNPYESLDPRHIVRAAVREPLDLHGIGSRADRTQQVGDALEAVGLRPHRAYADRYPHELSGGQRQRVAIARAVVLRPRLLVADEPVSMLDASIRSGVMNLLLDLRQDLGLSCLFITHDLAAARYMSEATAVMYRGEIVEQGPIDSVIAHPAHPYTRALIEAADFRGRANPVEVRGAGEASGTVSTVGCRFAPRCPLARERCFQETPALRSVSEGRLARCHFAEEVLGMAPVATEPAPPTGPHRVSTEGGGAGRDEP